MKSVCTDFTDGVEVDYVRAKILINLMPMDPETINPKVPK